MVSTIDAPTKVKTPIGLKKIPRPDYARHPGYGLLFGRPKLSTRIRAFKKLWPYLKEQALLVYHRKRTPQRAITGGNTLYDRVAREGAVGVRLSSEELAQLNRYLQPSLASLQARKAQIPPEKRVFKDMLLGISIKDAPEFISYLRQILERHGVIAAASRYLGAPVQMRDTVKLQITDRHDAPWHDHFADAGAADPATSYMHIDSSVRIMKCMLYLNEVTLDNGPFGYVIGSNNLKMSLFEYIVRKANDKARLDKCDPATRELFWALPKAMQLKSEFGNDMFDGAPETQALIEHEHKFTTADGHIVLFDNNGIHRGTRVIAGERHAMQIQLDPQLGPGVPSAQDSY
ncbi:MAG TPA: hypothetical protein V6D17_11505 [Candidatus Obscuribacterales bacterium]